MFRNYFKKKEKETNRCEFIHGFEQLDDQFNILAIDVGVNNVQETGHFSDDVKRLNIVRLLSQVVLKTTK